MSVTPSAPQKKSTNRWIVKGVIALAVTGIIVSFFIKSDNKPKRETSSSSIVNITLPPPPPPLPPPPPPPPQNEPPPPVEQEMIEQEPIAEEEQKPDETPAPDEPPADLTTGLTGDGPNSFGLSAGNGGTGGNGQIGGTGSGRRGSKFGWYGSGVQTSVINALKNHSATRTAKFNREILLWPDETGRIARVQIGGGSGDSSHDASIRQALIGLQLQEVAPADMPLPIRLRTNAR